MDAFHCHIGQNGREIVEAIASANLFDDVDFARHIGAPCRHGEGDFGGIPIFSTKTDRFE